MKTLAAAAAALLVLSAAASGQEAPQGVQGPDLVAADVPAAQLAATLSSLDQTEIKESRIAERQAGSGAVRAFAQKVARDRSQGEAELAELGRSAGLPALPYDRTRAVRAQEKASVAGLEAIRDGSDFDRAYLQRVIDGHKQALQQIDGFLSKHSSLSEPLNDYFKKTRQEVSDQLDQALQLQAQLGYATPAGG